jgi:hypothetical protein
LPLFLSTALRPQFTVEKDLGEIKEAGAAQEVRTCLKETPNNGGIGVGLATEA